MSLVYDKKSNLGNLKLGLLENYIVNFHKLILENVLELKSNKTSLHHFRECYGTKIQQNIITPLLQVKDYF